MIKGDLNIASNFAKKLAKVTAIKVDIYYISHDSLFDRSKNMRITISENIEFSNLRGVLYEDNTVWKNSSESKNKENVYFSFSRNQLYNIAFADDILNIDSFKSKNHLCLVQTSTSKYQAYFWLDRYVNASELYEIQKVLQTVYAGDVGALSAYQLKRLTGFINTKYGNGFIVRDVFWGNNKLKVNEVLDYYHTVIEIKKPKDENDKTISIVRDKSTTTKATKNWKDFAKNDNKSQTDMSFVCYLILKNHSDDEIEEILLKESEDIQTRKRNFNDYIHRTIEKARGFLQTKSS